MQRIRLWSWIGWGAAIAVSVGGLVTLLVGLVTPTAVGWFAYSPMSPTVRTSNVVLLSRRAALGATMLVLGLMGVGFLVGIRVGRRQALLGLDH